MDNSVATPTFRKPGLGLRSGDPTGMTSNGCWEARRRIAAALGVDPDLVKLSRYEVDLTGGAFHGTGIAGARRFFAKIYLDDSKPPLRRIPPYVTAQTDLDLLRHPEKTYGGSVENEWRMLRQIGDTGRDVHLPAVLGKSPENGTLVLEELQGARMDLYVDWRGWNVPRLREVSKVVARAATWLRNLHADSFDGTDAVSPRDLAHTIRAVVALRHLEFTRHGDLAWRVLEAYTDHLNRVTVRVPRCICHADFCLANLLWDRRRNRLAVLDFEHSAFGNVLHDLGCFLFDMRARLLCPPVSRRVVKALEGAFWQGYGTVSSEIATTVDMLVAARLFYFELPRLIERQQQGWISRAQAAVYIRWLEPKMIRRVLQSVKWFKSESRSILCLV